MKGANCRGCGKKKNINIVFIISPVKYPQIPGLARDLENKVFYCIDCEKKLRENKMWKLGDGLEIMETLFLYLSSPGRHRFWTAWRAYPQNKTLFRKSEYYLPQLFEKKKTK